MMTLEIIQRVWSLIPPPALDGTIEVRELEIATDYSRNPLLTIDGKGQRHLLIPAPQSIKTVEDRQSSGVQLLFTNWGEDDNYALYVDLICVKPHLNGLFDLIVYDVVSELLKSNATPDRICRLVLNQWRELLTRDLSLIPDRNTIVGLFGELVVLRNLVRINPFALKIWEGPNRARFDFFGVRHALEVKTSLQRQGIILTIHGHDQLDPPFDGNLYLAVLKIEDSPGDGESLNDLVKSIVSVGANTNEVYAKMARLGFLPETLLQVDNQRFRLVDQHLFLVDKEFPRITKANFRDEKLPRGVIAVNYQIDLSVPPPYPVQNDSIESIFGLIVEGLK